MKYATWTFLSQLQETAFTDAAHSRLRKLTFATSSSVTPIPEYLTFLASFAKVTNLQKGKPIKRTNGKYKTRRTAVSVPLDFDELLLQVLLASDIDSLAQDARKAIQDLYFS
jgi:hypothetical protein